MEDVLFDVAMQALYAKVGDRHMPVRDNLAIVEMPSGRVVSVVGRAYRLVTHTEAMSLEHDCARAAFPETRPGEWQVANVDAPSTCSTCFIDLVHNTGALDFSGLASLRAVGWPWGRNRPGQSIAPDP